MCWRRITTAYGDDHVLFLYTREPLRALGTYNVWRGTALPASQPQEDHGEMVVPTESCTCTYTYIMTCAFWVYVGLRRSIIIQATGLFSSTQAYL